MAFRDKNSGIPGFDRNREYDPGIEHKIGIRHHYCRNIVCESNLAAFFATFDVDLHEACPVPVCPWDLGTPCSIEV
jgi:hypothetical protein